MTSSTLIDWGTRDVTVGARNLPRIPTIHWFERHLTFNPREVAYAF